MAFGTKMLKCIGLASGLTAVFGANTALGCSALHETVMACDLVTMPQRLEVCAERGDDGSIEEMSYSFGTPGQEPELSFVPTNIWGASFHEGYFEVNELTQWGLGFVHPSGSVYLIYAYGKYKDRRIRRGVLQVFPTLDIFHQVTSRGKTGGATFHAECQPSTILGDFDFFAP